LHAFGEDLDVEFPVLDILEVTCMAAKSMCRNQIRKVEETTHVTMCGVFIGTVGRKIKDFFVLEKLGFLPLTQMGATLVQSGIESWCGAL
jgi:hypothetical protein